MKRTVPFTKTITFRTMISEITDIEVTHNLELKHDHEIEGDILVDGTYKMTDASQIEEEFHYKLPFTIDIDSKYDTKDLEITIGDFYFEIINEEDLKINVEIDMNGLEEKKQEVITSKITLEQESKPVEELKVEELFETEDLVRDDSNQLEIEPIPFETNETKKKVELSDNILNTLDEAINDTSKQETIQSLTKNNSVGSIFSSLANSDETFSTYYVYIIRENDTIESIIEKYKTTREEMQNYNDLEDVKVGSKLIIPCPTNE